MKPLFYSLYLSEFFVPRPYWAIYFEQTIYYIGPLQLLTHSVVQDLIIRCSFKYHLWQHVTQSFCLYQQIKIKLIMCNVIKICHAWHHMYYFYCIYKLNSLLIESNSAYGHSDTDKLSKCAKIGRCYKAKATKLVQSYKAKATKLKLQS